MFFLPFSFLLLVLFILLLPVLFILIQFGIVGAVSSKLGFPLSVGLFIYFLCILGSSINIPIKKERIEGEGGTAGDLQRYMGFPSGIKERIIAVNVGGCIIPVLLSIYLFQYVEPLKVIVAITIISVISYFLARPVKGIGIAIPALIPPIFCAILTIILSPGNPAFAYISGVLGTLIGADLMHLKDILGMEGRGGVMSIGGAGVFDGIFLVGIISVLLA